MSRKISMQARHELVRAVGRVRCGDGIPPQAFLDAIADAPREWGPQESRSAGGELTHHAAWFALRFLRDPRSAGQSCLRAAFFSSSGAWRFESARSEGSRPCSSVSTQHYQQDFRAYRWHGPARSARRTRASSYDASPLRPTPAPRWRRRDSSSKTGLRNSDRSTTIRRLQYVAQLRCNGTRCRPHTV